MTQACEQRVIMKITLNECIIYSKSNEVVICGLVR